MPSVYQIVTDRILDQLSKGVVPWQKPWSAGFAAPANLVSRKPYRGVNVFLLAAQGYQSPWWGTFNQIRELGGSVRKGEKGSPIVFWKFAGEPEQNDEGECEPRRAPLLRYYTVFNAEQADGIPADRFPAPLVRPSAEASIEQAAQLLADMPQPPTVEHVAGDRACYHRLDDTITMPLRNQFPIAARYFATLFHETVHATGHTSRLDRTFGEQFGDKVYAREELIAEMGAAFLAAEAGLTLETIDQSASYIATWLKALENDPQLVVYAAGRAQKAVDFIRNRLAAPAVTSAPAYALAA